MNVDSAASSRSLRYHLTVQRSPQRQTRERLQVPEGDPKPQQQQTANLGPVLDQKLNNVGRIHFAFGQALKMANAIESQFLFDPIV